MRQDPNSNHTSPDIRVDLSGTPLPLVREPVQRIRSNTGWDTVVAGDVLVMPNDTRRLITLIDSAPSATPDSTLFGFIDCDGIGQIHSPHSRSLEQLSSLQIKEILRLETVKALTDNTAEFSGLLPEVLDNVRTFLGLADGGRSFLTALEYALDSTSSGVSRPGVTALVDPASGKIFGFPLNSVSNVTLEEVEITVDLSQKILSAEYSPHSALTRSASSKLDQAIQLTGILTDGFGRLFFRSPETQRDS